MGWRFKPHSCERLLVVCRQDNPGRLLGMVNNAAEARVMLEALEAGTSGVVLKTEDPLQVADRRHLHAPTDCAAINLAQLGWL